MATTKEILEHHGIKGQRWGIRNKVNPQTGKVTGDHRLVSDLRKRPRASLTNKQLQTVNTRLGLEQNFSRLNPSVIKRGESHIRALVTTVGLVSSIVTLANTPAGKNAIDFINKHRKVTI